MKHFDFIIIGGGIAGLLTYYFLKKHSSNILLIDKKDILSSASGAAGAFLFPKIGFDSKYTRFINNAIIEAINFYTDLGIDTHTKGVLLLPRDEQDLEKFKIYEKEITLPFKKIDNGFYFDIGSVIEVKDVKNSINVNFLKEEVKNISKKDVWIINEKIKSKNIILATGAFNIINIPYINIRPIWGERIEIEAKYNSTYNLNKIYFHKNCSVAKIGNILRIGATHKRDCLKCKENEEEAKELIKKANEIIEIRDYKILSIKGGFRAASIDYFPLIGKIIDIRKTLLEDKHIVKGDMPKQIFYIDGLYIINGMGGRGFSNAVVCAKQLVEYIVKNKNLDILDTKRAFIKWARKNGEKYLKELKC